ncbi:hypothetical protein SETIT_5G436500v2 [Setaria italica]|uniref:Uncharacterized protein n=1 Tax=Setaria italica TaxID=4555 RepID=A0A368RF69_SETIT|nr:hypothetical protein SETIT_5G436500v2 [Setaria italica]
MLIEVIDSNKGLHMLLTSNPKWSWLLTDGGKFSMKSLKDLVVQAHREGWTLGKKQFSLENLIVSSIRTLKFKNALIKYNLPDDNQIEDFFSFERCYFYVGQAAA